MPERPREKKGHAFIAHDRIVTTARMYIQMIAVGAILAAIIYALAGNLFLSKYIAAPVPTLHVSDDGRPRLTINDDSPQLKTKSIFKYYFSLYPGNYINFGFTKSQTSDGVKEKYESVEPELLPLLKEDKVRREAYRSAVSLVTNGRVEQIRWILPVSLLFFPIFGAVYFYTFSVINKRSERTQFVRGDDLTPFPEMNQKLKAAINKEKSKNPTMIPLRIGPVELPDEVSRRHILVLGTTGTGKSVTLNQYLRSLRKRTNVGEKDQKTIIYDTKGEFCGKHFTDNDIIFYPFDMRSVPWSFFNEVEDYADLDVICTSLYEPPKDQKDVYWYNAARDVFRTGLMFLLRDGKTTNRDIVEFFAKPLTDIRNCLLTLPPSEHGALKHIDKTDSNQAASVISILQERIQFFRYMKDCDGDFSFRKYIRNGNDRRNLFLMNIRQYESIFKPLMTFVIDCMIREVLSLPDSFTRRITFLIDEFGSLSKMPGIFDFLTMGRSKGGFLVLANQDLGSVSDIYGRDRKETFFNNFNGHVVFRLNDPETAEFLAKACGEREVVKTFNSSQFSPSDFGDRFSRSEQEKLEKIILPTEFQNLMDFTAYLKIANFGLTQIKIPREFLQTVTKEFDRRYYDLQEMITEETPHRYGS